MKDKLKHLHSAMDETVFKDKEFTEENKNNVRRKIQEHQSRQSFNIFQRFGSWFKPVLSVAVCLFLLMGGIYVVTHQDGDIPKQTAQNNGSNSIDHQENGENATPLSKTEENHGKIDKKDNEKNNTKPKKPSIQTLISNIHQKTETGKIPNAPFIAGEATAKEIKTEWGKPDTDEKPDSLSKTKNRYMMYYQKQAGFGYRKDGVVFDVRSYQSELGNISLTDIKKIMGKPDSTSPYQDKTHDQKILVYNINDTYQLKWIVSSPTQEKPNPHVDHISVYNVKAAK